MGFSVKLAPGVRIRASSRGVRTSVGPRIARVHVGGGGTGFSTGAGPVSYYGSVGGGRRPSNGGSRTGSAGSGSVSRELAATRAAQARADKAAEGQRLLEALQAVERIHHGEFRVAERPVAPAPPAPDHAGLLRFHRSKAKSEVSMFPRKARNAALAEAARRAAHDAQQQAADLERQRIEWQAELDADWAALCRNDPQVVMAHLARAFEDNEAAAAPIGVDKGDASVVVVIPPMSAVPDRKPTVTQAGNLSLKKLTKTETVSIYKSLVCGHVLVTVKEAFAVAPTIASITAVAVRPCPADLSGKIRSEVLVAGRFERTALNGIPWQQSSSAEIFNDVASSKIFRERGATKELVPVDLAGETQLAALAASVDFEDLLGG